MVNSCNGLNLMAYRRPGQSVRRHIGWVGVMSTMTRMLVAFHAEGEAVAVDALVRWTHSGPAFARVDEVDTTRAEIAGLTMFEILS